MDFLNTFELSYSRSRGSARRRPATRRGGRLQGVGGVAVLKTHGGAWQVFAMGDGSSECVRAETREPDYEFLKSVFVTPEYSLRTRSGAGPSLEARLESAATARSENGGAAASGGADGFDWSIASVAEISAAVRAKALTSEDCDALGKSGLVIGAHRARTADQRETRGDARETARGAPGRRQRRVGLNRFPTRTACRFVSKRRAARA